MASDALRAMADTLETVEGPDGVELFDTPGAPLPDDAWQGLAAEACALVARLADGEPAVYGRYAHWWSTLPSAEVRVFPGGHQPLTAS